MKRGKESVKERKRNKRENKTKKERNKERKKENTTKAFSYFSSLSFFSFSF